MERQDYDEAVIWLYNAVYETESVLNIHCGGDLPLRGLAKCYQELGNEEQAAEYTRLAAEWQQEER